MPALKEPGDLPETVFGQSFNEGLIHQAVVTYEANQRADLANAKDRSQVSGANQKPWRQKGTGRARHGSRISPLWVGGGQAHAPDGTQDHSKQLTKRMKRQALASALSVRHKEGRIALVESLELDEPSTSSMHEFFQDEELSGMKLLLLHTPDENTVRLSTRNLDYCDPFNVNNLNTYQVVSHEQLLFTEDALQSFLERVDQS